LEVGQLNGGDVVVLDFLVVVAVFGALVEAVVVLDFLVVVVVFA